MVVHVELAMTPLSTRRPITARPNGTGRVTAAAPSRACRGWPRAGGNHERDEGSWAQLEMPGRDLHRLARAAGVDDEPVVAALQPDVPPPPGA